MWKYDLISSFSLLLFGISIIIGSLKLHIGTFANPGLALFPLLSGILLSILSGILFILSLLKSSSEKGGLFLRSWSWRQGWKPVSTVLCMALYGIAIDRLGFLFVTLLIMLFLFKVISGLSWKVSLSGTILTSFVSYFLFKIFLKVQLPIGLLGI